MRNCDRYAVIHRIGCFITIAVLTVFIDPIFCQIIEKGGPVPEKSGADTSARGQGCFPPCRDGYTCYQGKCVSLCNPSYPEDMECGKDAECHFVSAATVNKELSLIQRVTKVASAAEVMQGFIIKTGRNNSRVRIGDTSFTFDKELFLAAPSASYKILIDASDRSVDFHSVGLNRMEVKEIHSTLRPVKINLGAFLGPALIKNEVGMAGNLELGVNVLGKHYFGVTGNFLAPLVITYDDMTDTLDNIYPDTIRSRDINMWGGGITYGYSGFHVLRYMTIMPKVSVGYWEYDKVHYYYERGYLNGKHYNRELHSLESHELDYYFVKPGFELRFGYRVFSIRLSVDAFIGKAVDCYSGSIGFLASIL